MKTTTFWKSGQAFDTFQENTKLEIDANTGFGPKAMLLSGLGACSGIDVVEVLEKMRVPFADLEIEVEAEQNNYLFANVCHLQSVQGNYFFPLVEMLSNPKPN